MVSAVIESVRLTAFKTFRDATLPLQPLTVLIGRNGSGKSNALDGLEVLARLAEGEDIRDALEGRRRDSGPIRGGIEGCPPHNERSFKLGCTVTAEDGSIDLDVEIEVEPEVRLVYERLSGPTGSGQKVLLETHTPEPDRVELTAGAYNGKRGPDPGFPFRSSRLLTAQLPLRIYGETEAERSVLHAASEVLRALAGVFHLDPIPHLMRQYVLMKDANLRRTAENLSATVGGLERSSPEHFARLLSLLRETADHEIRGISVAQSDFGDVMFALEEGRLGRTPVREMSDGMLRFVAIAAALLAGGTGLDLHGSDVVKSPSSVMVVIEELENGLHPTQAAQVLRLVREASARERSQVLVTTHSPALLNGLEGRDHRGVVVSSRDRNSDLSVLQPLPQVEGYAPAMARGRLGEVVTEGEPAAPCPPTTPSTRPPTLISTAH